jgi:hypothetical protein
MPDDKKDFVIPALNKNSIGRCTYSWCRCSKLTMHLLFRTVMTVDRSREVINQGASNRNQSYLKSEGCIDEYKDKLDPVERAKRKAMLVQAFDRGIVHDRLAGGVTTPYYYGEWCRNDPDGDRSTHETIGF